MRRMAQAALLLGIAGCSTEDVDSGTAVGNPGKMTAALDDGLAPGALSSGFYAEDIVATGCDESDEQLVLAGVWLDLLEGAEFQLPPGEFCSLTVSVEGGLTVAGTLSDERDYDLSLPVDAFTLLAPAGFGGSGQELLLLLGADGVVDEEALEELAGDPVVVDRADELAVRLTEELLDTTVLVDLAGEGEVVGAQDPELWDLDADEQDADDEVDAGGCSGGNAGPLLLLPGLLGLRRRREA